MHQVILYSRTSFISHETYFVYKHEKMATSSLQCEVKKHESTNYFLFGNWGQQTLKNNYWWWSSGKYQVRQGNNITLLTN